MEIRVVTLGLDGAGKTTILFKLKQDEFMQPIPTIGKYAYCFYLNEYFIGKTPNLQMSSQGLTLRPSDVEIGCKTSAFQRKNARFSDCGIEMWIEEG